jgi:hypothetical protein
LNSTRTKYMYPCRRSFCPAGTSGSFSGSTSKPSPSSGRASRQCRPAS